MLAAMMHTKKKVLIIGAGPVGLTLACQLRSSGVMCRLIEKRHALSQHSKALSINAASLKILDSMKIVERFLSQGKIVSDIYAYWNDRRIMRVNYRHLDSPYPYFLSLPQPKSEKILSDYFNELGGNIERGVILRNIKVAESGVDVELEDRDQQIESEVYDYVIACDGGKSTTREALGLAFSGQDYGINFRLIDVFIEWDGPTEETHYFIKEDGFIIVIPMAGGFHRIVIHEKRLSSCKSNTTLAIESYQKLVNYYSPGNITLKGNIIWESSAPFYNRLIEQYQLQQRVFFAGDSAHLFSPIGGQGMNTGLQDVNNLAWKLSGVIKHGWSRAILKTYADERAFIGGILVKSTDDSTQLIARLQVNDQEGISRWLPLMKNRVNIRSNYPMRFSGLMQQYPTSSFIANSATEQHSLLGRHLPYVKINNANLPIKSTYDVVGQLPVLFVFGELSKEIVDIAAAQRFDVYQILTGSPERVICNDKLLFTIVDADDALKTAFSAIEGEIFLIRPDGFIGFTGNIGNVTAIKNYLGGWYGR